MAPAKSWAAASEEKNRRTRQEAGRMAEVPVRMIVTNRRGRERRPEDRRKSAGRSRSGFSVKVYGANFACLENSGIFTTEKDLRSYTTREVRKAFWPREAVRFRLSLRASPQWMEPVCTSCSTARLSP